MLTPDQLEALPRRFVQLWQQVEDDILQDIARRMKSLGELDPLTPTAIWQAWRLAETRAVRSNTVATLAKYTGKSRAEIKRLLETAGAQTLAADDAVYAAAGLDPPPVNQSPALLNLLNAGYRQTYGTWQNLTATTANTVTGAFEDRLSRAWGLVSTGAMDYNTAIRRTVDDLADTMPYITYPSGHTDTLEVAARRAVLTGVNQTCAKLQLKRTEEMGCEFVEVTAHEGARPTHAVWQGRVYHRGGAVVQRTVSGTRILKPPLVTAPAPACAAGTAATTFTRSIPASPCATTRMNAWPNWTPAIFPMAAGCTPSTRSPRCSGHWNARYAGTSAVTWPKPPPGWMPAKAPPS